MQREKIRVQYSPCFLIILTVTLTIDSFPSCCVCRWTFNRSNGWVQQAAPAEANPPKYHLDNFLALSSSTITAFKNKSWQEISRCTINNLSRPNVPKLTLKIANWRSVCQESAFDNLILTLQVCFINSSHSSPMQSKLTIATHCNWWLTRAHCNISLLSI